MYVSVYLLCTTCAVHRPTVLAICEVYRPTGLTICALNRPTVLTICTVHRPADLAICYIHGPNGLTTCKARYSILIHIIFDNKYVTSWSSFKMLKWVWNKNNNLTFVKPSVGNDPWAQQGSRWTPVVWLTVGLGVLWTSGDRCISIRSTQPDIACSWSRRWIPRTVRTRGQGVGCNGQVFHELFDDPPIAAPRCRAAPPSMWARYGICRRKYTHGSTWSSRWTVDRLQRVASVPETRNYTPSHDSEGLPTDLVDTDMRSPLQAQLFSWHSS